MYQDLLRMYFFVSTFFTFSHPEIKKIQNQFSENKITFKSHTTHTCKIPYVTLDFGYPISALYMQQNFSNLSHPTVFLSRAPVWNGRHVSIQATYLTLPVFSFHLQLKFICVCFCSDLCNGKFLFLLTLSSSTHYKKQKLCSICSSTQVTADQTGQ